MIRLSAYAKINLALQVLGKRPDGYHEIDSIMQSVSLSDEVAISISGSGIELILSDKTLPIDWKNTAYKAAQVFFDKTGIKPSAKIEIQKRIPVAAGLAGGSADAAAVFVGLNRLYKTKLTESDLNVLGAEVGSDVPFCIIGGKCRCRGRGELVEKILNPKSENRTWYIIIKPNFNVSTKWVYDNYVPAKIDREIDSLAPFNDLEQVVLPKYPEVQTIKKRLVDLGCVHSQMSGSGPSVFGLAPDFETVQKIYDQMKTEYAQTFVVEPVDVGIALTQ